MEKRKDKGGVMKLEAVSVAEKELEALWHKKHDAAEAFRTLVSSVAAQAECEPSVLSSWFNAKMRDRLEAHQKKLDQMSMLLDL